MAKDAVIKLAGQQHYVTEGDRFVINRTEGKEGDKVTVKDILLTVDGDDVKIGAPMVEGASVMLKVVKVNKGKKVVVVKFRAKSRYRRKNGHRQPQSTLEVVSINTKD